MRGKSPRRRLSPLPGASANGRDSPSEVIQRVRSRGILRRRTKQHSQEPLPPNKEKGCRSQQPYRTTNVSQDKAKRVSLAVLDFDPRQSLGSVEFLALLQRFLCHLKSSWVVSVSQWRISGTSECNALFAPNSGTFFALARQRNKALMVCKSRRQRERLLAEGKIPPPGCFFTSARGGKEKQRLRLECVATGFSRQCATRGRKPRMAA